MGRILISEQLHTDVRSQKFADKHLARHPLYITLYYDSTVEPFAYVQFDKTQIQEKLSLLKSKSYEIKVYDIAGWPYQIIKKTYENIRKFVPDIRKLDSTYIGPGHKIYFGREIPSLVVYHDIAHVCVYPILYKNRLISIAHFLDKLIGSDEI